MFYKQVYNLLMDHLKLFKKNDFHLLWTNILFLLASGILLFAPQLLRSQDPGEGETAGEGTVIDQVIAVIGSNIVLQSDLQAQFEQYRAESGIQGTEASMKCFLLKSMIYQKLLMNQAELDSVEVTDGQVESELDRRLRYYISLVGSQEKFEEFYQKSVVDFKEELREEVRELIMVQNVQQTLTENVKVTPTEVRSFYKSIPTDSLPYMNSKLSLAQIVKMPPVNKEEVERVKNKLQEIRYRVLNGENFATLAILYSEDPGSSKQGGELGLFGRGQMFPEFEAAAFSLDKGEVSEIVKTDAGYHILQSIERRGEYVNVRHILLRPKVSPTDLYTAKTELDSIAGLIEKGTFTFEEAVVKFSDDPSKNNGGLLINPMSNTSLWESDELDPKVFFVIDKLAVGELSAPVQFQTQDGKDAYRILLMKDRTEPHQANLKQDYDFLQESALQKKQQEELDKWVMEKVENTYIQVNDEYRDCQFFRDWEAAR
jgi:peptidyl-prolyl cis-trans isomerase SurA